MKKLLLLALGTLCALPAFARDFTYTYQGHTITYTVIDETAKTVQTKAGQVYGNSFVNLVNRVSGSLILPSTVYDGSEEYTLTTIASLSFYSCSELTSITIPYSVTEIGDDAFRGCRGLTSITIPNSVTKIGAYTFAYCSGLTSVTIPNSVTKIGYCAFESCNSMTEVTFNAENCTSCGAKAFPYNITSLTIGENVKCIPMDAFKGCKGLTSLVIPNSVTEIGVYAFDGCSGLTSVIIGNSVTSIGYCAFRACSGLTSVTIPNSVTSIGSSAFAGCSGLTSVSIPNSVTSIDGAFSYCSGLTSVTIPNSVTEIGGCAFEGCRGLTSVTIPNSVTTIGDRAFYDCWNLTSVTIPNSVTSIGGYAFEGCRGLTSLTIGDSVTKIGDWAFAGCSGLERIYSYAVNPPVCEHPNYTSNDVFSNVDKQSCVLYVPKGSKAAYRSADRWRNFVNIVEMRPEPVGPGMPLTLYRIHNKHHAGKYLTMDEDKMLIAADLDESNPQQLFKIEPAGEKVTLAAQGTFIAEASHAPEVQNGTSDTEPGLFYLVRNGDEVAFDKERPNGGTFAAGSRALSVPHINNAHVSTWATGTPYSWWYLEEVTSMTLNNLVYNDGSYYGNITMPFAFSTDAEVYTGLLNDNILDMTEIDHDFVEAGKPVIIRSASPEVTLNFLENVDEPSVQAADNHLSGNLFAADAPESAHAFCVLPDPERPAFAANSRAIGRNESYLDSSMANHNEVLLNIDGTVSIDELSVDGAIEVYDLRGVRVGDSTDGLPHGVYIVKTATQTTKVAI